MKIGKEVRVIEFDAKTNQHNLKTCILIAIVKEKFGIKRYLCFDTEENKINVIYSRDKIVDISKRKFKKLKTSIEKCYKENN